LKRQKEKKINNIKILEEANTVGTYQQKIKNTNKINLVSSHMRNPDPKSRWKQKSGASIIEDLLLLLACSFIG
jgi:hypothetical protein